MDQTITERTRQIIAEWDAEVAEAEATYARTGDVLDKCALKTAKAARWHGLFACLTEPLRPLLRDQVDCDLIVRRIDELRSGIIREAGIHEARD